MRMVDCFHSVRWNVLGMLYGTIKVVTMLVGSIKLPTNHHNIGEKNLETVSVTW